MGCHYPWSNQDEFYVQSDCHVWAPFYLITDIWILLFGTIHSLRCVHRVWKTGWRRGAIVGVAGTGCAILVCVFAARTATGLVMGSKNVALNFFHGLSMGFFWSIIGLIVKQYMDVMLLTAKGVTQRIMERFQLGLAIITIAISATTMFFFLVPCFTDSVTFDGFWGAGVFGQVTLTTLLLYYGLQVRQLLNAMEVSKPFYTEIIKRLDKFMIPWMFTFFPLCVTSVLCMVLPYLYNNNYIMVNVFMLQLPGFVDWLLKLQPTEDKQKEEQGEREVTEMSGEGKTPRNPTPPIAAPSPTSRAPLPSPSLAVSTTPRPINSHSASSQTIFFAPISATPTPPTYTTGSSSSPSSPALSSNAASTPPSLNMASAYMAFAAQTRESELVDSPKRFGSGASSIELLEPLVSDAPSSPSRMDGSERRRDGGLDEHQQGDGDEMEIEMRNTHKLLSQLRQTQEKDDVREALSQVTLPPLSPQPAQTLHSLTRGLDSQDALYSTNSISIVTIEEET